MKLKMKRGTRDKKCENWILETIVLTAKTGKPDTKYMILKINIYE